MRMIEYDDIDLDEPEGKYGFCASCECNVTTVQRDEGIGAYEYWGCTGVHHDWRDVCPTCGDEVTEEARELECEE